MFPAWNINNVIGLIKNMFLRIQPFRDLQHLCNITKLEKQLKIDRCKQL